tara:strand:- start:915 stop:1763 length:849 start_codon:yes stop_codon:yes gene_type:complete
MSLHFDGAGTVALAAPWSPTDPFNFEVEVEFEFPGEQAYNVFGSLIGKNDNKGSIRIGNGNHWIHYEGPSSSVQFKVLSVTPVYQVTKKIRARVVSSTAIEIYHDDEVTPSETLSLDAGKEFVDFTVTHLGSRGGNSEFLPTGAILHSVKLTDLAAPANSSIYLLDEGTGTAINDTGALGNNGTLIGFTDLAAAWGSQSPTVSLAADLRPGVSFTLNYSNYAAVPVSPVTITDSNNNSITVPVTINDNGDGTGSATGTMPSLPSSGTAQGLLFGSITVDLGT